MSTLTLFIIICFVFTIKLILLFCIKLCAYIIIHVKFVSFWDYVTIYRARRDRMLWLHSCSIMSLSCFYSYFRLYEFALLTISRLFCNCDFCVRSFDWRKEDHESSSNRWYVAQSLISRFCRKCLKKRSIYTFWRSCNFFFDFFKIIIWISRKQREW
jgi:hypothetical protein